MTQPVPAVPPATAATYVFAVCRHVDEDVLPQLPGITTAPVRVLPFERLHAVVQEVPAADADRRSWTERLSDPRELERCVRAHHQVVTAVAAHGPAAPMALATLYNSEERARQALGADAARFHTVLDRVDGRVEWGVKVYVSSASAATKAGRTAVPTRVPAGPPPSGAGRAYLERVRGTHRAREDSRRAALLTAKETDAVLRGLAVAARRLRLQDQQLTDCHRAQVLNGAYLVDESQAAQFTEAVATLRERTGALIELSGPWVPYSFAGEDGLHGER
ncbi:GvpL/GvpF family gas vesicle protein [Streptomyces phyllanthi]|uniref:GvpL/GvpF family gas vesicle protein n=1 Tax=Streptomyces phyllanthi TaxID=1803180 RepID=A0A5N8VTI7_9ACTN|nr:GvpL/GvpF family gas vesicle protein [Streptomyces phyllanthi]MPY38550.1 GvpL/GvpF family gas vesicle protein [Streptomyces phyllanthi]